MKRPERLKLVEDIRKLLPKTDSTVRPALFLSLLKEAADCIEQLENELDAIHENFLKESE